MNSRSRLSSVAWLVTAIASGLVASSILASCAQSGQSAHPARSGKVLLVGTYKGVKGGFSSIQAAVDASKPGDWILVAPGDYHEAADMSGKISQPGQGDFGGVLINTSDIQLRGMNRSTVIVDGTKVGSQRCSNSPPAQSFGVSGNDGKPIGRNGIVVWKANDVSISNLTVCNFLAGTGASGNEIWWNGGDGSGKIGLTGYQGSYLTATSTYFGGEATAAQYGIFSSSASGPATWNQLYGSNFNDGGIYIGGCLRVCDVTISNAWMEYNALGYSGTNSGGAVVVKNSQFDQNQDGFDTNTQIDADPPAPQDGTCPGGATSPITHTHSCWVFMDNYVHDNNNPTTPSSGSAAAGPVGTGMTLSGGRYDTVMNNRFVNNGAWGFLLVPYPDSGKAVQGQTCSGTGGFELPGLGCVYDPEGDSVHGNTFVHNGYFANPTNADFGQITLAGSEPQNCFSGNIFPDGSQPADLQTTEAKCGATTKAAGLGGQLLFEVGCDTGFLGCPPGANYPKVGSSSEPVVMHPLPKSLPSMPNPCAGVPSDAWCVGGKPL